VTDSLALARRIRALGAKRLLLAQMDWDRLFSSATPPGAPTPEVAKASLTRHAIRQKEQRRKALRSGIHGLKRAILAA
jgi:hypothetical protein